MGGSPVLRPSEAIPYDGDIRWLGAKESAAMSRLHRSCREALSSRPDFLCFGLFFKRRGGTISPMKWCGPAKRAAG